MLFLFFLAGQEEQLANITGGNFSERLIEKNNHFISFGAGVSGSLQTQLPFCFSFVIGFALYQYRNLKVCFWRWFHQELSQNPAHPKFGERWRSRCGPGSMLSLSPPPSTAL